MLIEFCSAGFCLWGLVLAKIKLHRLNPVLLKAYDLWTLDRREFSSGDKCSDAIAFGDWEQEMRWAFGVVMYGHLRRDAARNMADPDEFEIISGGIVVRAFDFDGDAFSGLKQNAVGTDFDIKFINLIGFERLPFRMQVNGLPGFGRGGVEFSLRSAEPASRQESATAVGIEMP
jgi:hypothetical protein